MAAISWHTNLGTGQTMKHWNPAFLLQKDPPMEPLSYGTIVLNQPIENVEVFLRVCSRSRKIVAADGGANRIHDLQLQEKTESLQCEPHCIIGDLDSIRPDVRRYYEERGAEIIHDTDQNTTDLTKALRFLALQVNTVAIIGGLGGRADQAFAQLHQLYTASQDQGLGFENLYLFTPESVVFLLQKGLNTIHTHQSTPLFGENVGIIPLAAPAIISTRGLEWDVQDWRTSFGTQVSTSNHIRRNFVVVETDERVLFTLELQNKK